MFRSFKRYFDLQSEHRAIVPKDQAPPAHAPVIPQYLAATAGVIVEPFLRHYAFEGAWEVSGQTLIGRIVFGLIIGIILLPAIYKSAFDPQKPVLVQLAALFPMGIGWQSLVATSAKLTLGS